jgi:hypothetical protein
MEDLGHAPDKTDKTGADLSFVIDIPVRNDWESVDLLRTSIVNSMTAIFAETDSAESFATVAAELLENAIKYGQWKDPAAMLHLRVSGDGDGARIEVAHPVDAASDNTRELLEMIDWIKTFPSPEEAYRARLLQIATAETGVSKLGLARIAYEGMCDLEAQVEGDILRVTSVTRR